MVKIKIILIILLLDFIFSDPPVIPNECSSLGNNNPLKAMDCKVFKFENNKQWCCYFTVTNTTSFVDEDTMTTEYIKSKGTACVVLNSITSKEKSKKLEEIQKNITGDRMLIQCNCDYIIFNKILFLFFIILFLF
jgi:hypothetical protein